MSMTDVVMIVGAYAAFVGAFGALVGALYSIYLVVAGKGKFRDEFGHWATLFGGIGSVVGFLIGFPVVFFTPQKPPA
jgi:hypothetical protein